MKTNMTVVGIKIPRKVKSLTVATVSVYLTLLATILFTGCDKNELLEPEQAANQGVSANCCSDYPWKLSHGGESLVEAVNNLVTGFGAQQCHPKVVSLTSIMQAKYYIKPDAPGLLSFGVHYRTDNVIDSSLSSDKLRFIWSTDALGYRYYGACSPEHIFYPSALSALPGKGENHVFAAKLIPVDEYRRIAPVEDINTVEGIPISQITEVVNVFLEGKNGFIASKESANYNRPYSSKGVIVHIKLQNNQQKLCYLLNNYDNKSILWKEKNRCQELFLAN